MADSASELESDCSSVDGAAKNQVPASKEQLQKRCESLQQESKVLKVELDTYKLRCKHLVEENKNLRKASVSIQAKAEQEEEFISNMLLKKIQVLKKEKEALAMNYEKEEEYLTNDLSRKLCKLKEEKVHLEKTLEQEQELQVNKLLKKIRKLEADTSNKQANLEQLRREKIELENTLEQEQEALVNKLWKRMEKLEAEKRILQEKLDQPISEPPSPQPIQASSHHHSNSVANIASAAIHASTVEQNAAKSESALLTRHVQQLKTEVAKLKKQLEITQSTQIERLDQINREERLLRHESQNMRQRFLEETIYARTLSESESSVDMSEDDGGGYQRCPLPPMDQSPRGSTKILPRYHNHHHHQQQQHYLKQQQQQLQTNSVTSIPLLSSGIGVSNTSLLSTRARNIPSPSPNNNGTGSGSLLTNTFLLRRSVSPMNVVPLNPIITQQTPLRLSGGLQSAYSSCSYQPQHHHTCPNCTYSFPCPPSYPQSIPPLVNNQIGSCNNGVINLLQHSNEAVSNFSNHNYNNLATPNANPNVFPATNYNNSCSHSNWAAGSFKKRSPSAEFFAKPPVPPPSSYTSFTTTPPPPSSPSSTHLLMSNSGNLPTKNDNSAAIRDPQKQNAIINIAAAHPASQAIDFNTPPGALSQNEKCPSTLTKQGSLIPGGTRFKPLILKSNLMEKSPSPTAMNSSPIPIGNSKNTYYHSFKAPKLDSVEIDEDDEANKTPPSNNNSSYLMASVATSSLATSTKTSVVANELTTDTILRP